MKTVTIGVHMLTSSNGNIFRVTGHLCGEFTGPGEFPTQRPVTRSFDVYFDLRLNKRLSKQSRGRLFETLSHPLWRHCNAGPPLIASESLDIAKIIATMVRLVVLIKQPRFHCDWLHVSVIPVACVIIALWMLQIYCIWMHHYSRCPTPSP